MTVICFPSRNDTVLIVHLDIPLLMKMWHSWIVVIFSDWMNSVSCLLSDACCPSLSLKIYFDNYFKVFTADLMTGRQQALFFQTFFLSNHDRKGCLFLESEVFLSGVLLFIEACIEHLRPELLMQILPCFVFRMNSELRICQDFQTCEHCCFSLHCCCVGGWMVFFWPTWPLIVAMFGHNVKWWASDFMLDVGCCLKWQRKKCRTKLKWKAGNNKKCQLISAE